MDSPTVETARLRLIGEMLERAQEELERARPAITAMETEQGLFYPRDCEIPNHGFDDPPPSYDQACKDDESPPLYETLGYGNVMAVFGAERASSTTANQNSIGRASEVTAHEAPSHSVLIPPNSRSAPPRQGSISDAAYISTTLQQIQNYVEEMRERFSQSDVDSFISSLSIMTPLLPSPTEHRSTYRL